MGLTKRIRPSAHWASFRVTLDLGTAGRWGLAVDSGRAAVTGAPLDAADVTIRCSPEVLFDIFALRRPGYEAFLAGELEVRGNLSIALELESMFEPEETTPDGWPRTVHVMAGKTRWSVLEAGPPDAPPVLLLHGLGATKASMLPTVAELSRDHRVLACDVPGFGDSAKPRGAYDAPWFAARVIELLDTLEIKRAALVGNSMGGRISIETALRAPERVGAMVGLCPALAFLRFRQAVPLVRVARPELGIVPLRPRRQTVMMTLRGIMAHPDRIPSSWFEAAADEFFRVFAKPRGRLAFYAAARHIYLDEPHGEAGFWARVAALDVPSLFVFGRHDPLVPWTFSRRVAAAAASARIEVLDDCGHVPQFEEPERTHALIRELLSV